MRFVISQVGVGSLSGWERRVNAGHQVQIIGRLDRGHYGQPHAAPRPNHQHTKAHAHAAGRSGMRPASARSIAAPFGPTAAAERTSGCQ